MGDTQLETNRVSLVEPCVKKDRGGNCYSCYSLFVESMGTR